MSDSFLSRISDTLKEIEDQGLYKIEREITSPQSAEITVKKDGQEKRVLNFCANNYLGLADHPALIRAAHDAAERYGYGMASVRFICGTQDIHRELEHTIADFLGYDDSILFAACFDANGGVFEPLLTADDAIISDELNHASIIDGVRLCKANRYRFRNNDADDLEAQLKQADADGARTKLVVTDGVFSMDGYIANLDRLCEIAKKYDALVMVDDCHATGFMGEGGRGTPEHHGVMDKVDILTGTLGKALGGAMGGYICAAQPVIDLLRQRARPYLFSNALTPSLVGASIKAIELVREGADLRRQLFENARQFRTGMTDAGFELLPGEHPIIPVMLHDAALSQKMANRLFELGIYVTGFFYPVVPKGKARIRTQISAAHTPEQIDRTIDAFTTAGKELGVI
ncbi:glycine C-acetyltransferase [Aquisalinus flavus]|uniref:2-amino-3-ketobutyrate coenzyme A ligase n=1 Tax=Aquisalinus flavus TaxID=1526572 RepID=A0A8J2V2P6_9PROT|nr:glycine C-acetyltransferase [Aquisalinus flavus]MBD0426680.1 glycine C-acetyltransferase [Aquisalinus flavus]UNE47782.1 glycine C-acetyltransferase [Aquisalinus flavus]GGD05891.1 2-amino-3-ketobutyrate coenzyme A ligase [Aquisalinus flavus]